MRTSTSDLGHIAVGLCLDDINPFLTSSVKRIKYAIKAAKMGRTNIPKTSSSWELIVSEYSVGKTVDKGNVPSSGL